MSRTYARRKNRLTMSLRRYEKPSWLDADGGEIEAIVGDLVRRNVRFSDIGMKLRDERGIPDIKLVTGMSMKKTADNVDAKRELPDDLKDMVTKALRIRNHHSKNRNDKRAKRDIFVVESRVRKLASYYIKRGVLPQNWRYSYQNARLLVGK